MRQHLGSRSSALLFVLASGLSCSRWSPARPAEKHEPPAEASASPAPTPWWKDAVGYEIFVRSFSDSNDDGIGDLRGLIDKLDYLNDGDPKTNDDLGVDLLWLMPINEGPSDHGYAVSDYRAIERDYGTMADFEELLARARARGVRIILDLVVNHSSDEHPWFVEAARSSTSARRGYYIWRKDNPEWSPPWGAGGTWHAKNGAYYYGLFSPAMPDLNLESSNVRAEIIDIARFWLSRGVSGFRLDAARYLVETGRGPTGQADTPPTHAFWRELRSATEAMRPETLLLGEIWAGTPVVTQYFGTPSAPELNMAFDFDTASGMLNAIRRGDAEPARIPLATRLQQYPPWAGAGTFLANHDQYRVATALANGGVAARKLAAALLLAFPGTPWLYYGEEIGLSNGAEGSDDRLKRRPMQWTGEPGVGFTRAKSPWMAPASIDLASSVAGQTHDPKSLLSIYRQLIHIRHAHAALRRGKTTILEASGSSSEPLVLLRADGDDEVLLVFNFSEDESDIVVESSSSTDTLRFEELLGRAGCERPDSGSPFIMPRLEGRGFRIFARRAATRS